MLQKILLNPRLKFPHFSFALIVSSLVISVPILFNSVLYAYLGANIGLVYPWQYFTSIFTHGPDPNLLIHLLINLLVIIIFGVTIEKLLGAWRIFILSIITIAVVLFLRLQILEFEHGISVIVWSYAPIAFIISIKEIKENGWLVLINPFIILCLLLYFIVWIGSTVYLSLVYSLYTELNLYHTLATVIGVIFLFIWKNNIDEKISLLQQENINQMVHKSRLNKTAIFLGYFLVLLNLLSFVVVWIMHL